VSVGSRTVASFAAMKLSNVIVVAGFLMACGGGGGPNPGDPDAPPGAADADPDGWQVLAQGTWTLPTPTTGNTDHYYCIYATVPRDIYIKALRPLSPLGTHHTVATYYTGASPADGIYPCDVGTNGQNMFFGSGVGSIDFPFPDGVGLHLTAGTRVLVNLHLYNASEGELTGTSGTLFQEATAAEIQNEAEVVLGGPTFNLTVPTGMSIQTGNCHMNNVTTTPVQLFALSQHMHKLGYHMKSTIARSGSPEIVLQDIDYMFERQTFQSVDPHVELLPGDVLTTDCYYNNDTGAVVTFGESSDDEMCFTDLFYYPAQGADFICTF
jgi:hypothetical protein